MDKDTKIELLKVLGMLIILVILIFGIVYLNKAHDVSLNEINTIVEESSTKETNTGKSEQKSNKSSNSSKEKDSSKKDNKKD